MDYIGECKALLNLLRSCEHENLQAKHTKALSSLIKQCEWREIETAPKDGTLILLCNPRMAVMAVAGWDSYVLGADAEGGETEGGWSDVGSRNAGIGTSWNGEYFDYWLPLPPSPGEYK